MDLSKEKLVEKTMKYKFVPLILAIFTLAVGLRYFPVRNMEYLQASDPYNLFRMSQQIAYTGGLPELDFMRNFPYAMPLYNAHIGPLAIPAILYWMGGSMIFDTYLNFAYWVNPLFSGIAAVTMYFLGKELYDKYTGLGAAFFIAILPGAMQRSSAGFFEKEALGTMFLVISLLFFTRAWKRKSWMNGTLSGLALGLFTISWGGSEMLWLLYPMIIGFMILIDKDIENLIAAYTPTILIAAVFAAGFNNHRFWFTDTTALLAFGFLSLLWARYIVGELELLPKKQLPYFGVTSYALGAIALLLSPLYSNTLAQIMLSIYTTATQTSGSVIGGTVAENAPPETPQIVAELGTGTIGQAIPATELLAATVSTWTLVVLAVPLMISTMLLMLGKQYGIIEELKGKKHYALIAGTIAGWSTGLGLYLIGNRVAGLITATTIILIIAIVVYYLDEDSAFTISSMSLIFAAVLSTMMAFQEQNTLAAMRTVAYPAWIAALGLGAIYYLDDFKDAKISLQWYKVIPLFWIATNLLGAVARNRLLYLAAFPVALGAGYTFSIVLNRLKDIDLSEIGLKTSNLRIIAIAGFILLALTVNLFAGWAAVQNIGGSPNEAWHQNLDYLNDQTPDGSVTMSWWDYGYHFQSIGRTGTVADGGNFVYYYQDGRHINYHLADYFASTSTEDHEEFLEKHSVDHLVLDNTMIGKYAAVSQIHEGSNEEFDRFHQFQTIGGDGRIASTREAISQSENRSVVSYGGGIGQSFANLYVPISQNNGSIEFADTATARLQNGEQLKMSCALTSNGVQEFGDGESDYCIAQDPYYNIERGLQAGSQSRMVVMERHLAETTFAKLYLMDGHDIPYAEKVEEGSNDYVKMWEIE